MRKSIVRLVSLLCVIAPMAATAQKNILSAFDAIIKCKDAQITESHSLERNPETLTKTGQSDVYSFELPAKQMNLINNVITAFDKDSALAYSLNRGKAAPSDPQIALAVGDGSGAGIKISNPGHDYIYATFLAPKSEDPNRIYRYAYGLSYIEEDGKIRGKLVVTYATTLMHRQQLEEQNRYDRLRDLSNIDVSNGAIYITSPQTKSWFGTVMSYLQNMTSANTQTRIALATKVYLMTRDIAQYTDVTSTDKDSLREILKGMISDKKYSESVLNELLNQCLINLSK